MITICCVIVLYKMRLNESPAFRRAYAQKCIQHKIRFFIMDNSPEADNTYQNYPDVHYEHCPDNKGLGHAYNAAARFANKERLEWLLLLDQDTILAEGFFDSYINAISTHPDISLFVPQVLLSNGSALSPLRRWKAQKKVLNSNRCYPIKHYLLINSGLCVRLSIFERCGGYNEQIWLDFADTQFIRKIWHLGEKYFYLLPYNCYQTFSDTEIELDRIKSRFDIYLECASHYQYLDLADWLFFQHCRLSHILSLTIRTRSGYFIKRFIAKSFSNNKRSCILL